MQIVGIVIVALIVLALAACSAAPFILSGRICAKEDAVPLESVIAATSIIAHDGDCMERPLVGACGGCPFRDEDCDLEPAANVARARQWLADRHLGSLA